MRLTLKSLESLMTSSLSNIDVQMNQLDGRIDRLQSDLHCDLRFNVYDRLDTLSQALEKHRKETAERFDEVGERFDKVEARFDTLEAEVRDMPARILDDLANMLCPYPSHNDSKFFEHDRRINDLEKKTNLSRRIFYYSMR